MRDLKTQSRVKWVDNAKGIGLILVIVGHLDVPLLPTWIYTFHMPLFFFLSGCVFSGGKYSFSTFLKKRIQSLVIPYFFLGAGIYIFYVGFNAITNQKNGLYGTASDMLIALFRQEHFWTIWFLTCLFLVEIIYYLLDIWTRNIKHLTTFASLAICILGFIRYSLGCNGLPWNLDIALVAQFFFHLGHVFTKSSWMSTFVLSRDRIKTGIMACVFLSVNVICGWLCIYVSGESLDMSVGLYGNEILTLFSAVFGILFIIIIANQIKSFVIEYLGKNTMIIFAWHSRICIVFCNYIFEYFNLFQENTVYSRTTSSLITMLVIFAVLIPLTELIKRTPVHRCFGV